jgi:hypothetical protein
MIQSGSESILFSMAHFYTKSIFTKFIIIGDVVEWQELDQEL